MHGQAGGGLEDHQKIMRAHFFVAFLKDNFLALRACILSSIPSQPLPMHELPTFPPLKSANCTLTFNI